MKINLFRPALLLFSLFLFSHSTAFCQPGPTTDANRKTGQAARVGVAPRLDGQLDDACWLQAPVMGDFVANSPSFGQPAAEKTEVRIVYTNEAIYVGAYLYQLHGKVRTDLCPRDDSGTGDQFHIAFDTYRDRQNAFRFQITASNVQLDGRMSPTNFDVSWDAVWESKVKLQPDGWSVEVRIPFSALRFPKTAEQTWGIQFARQIQYNNEFCTWSPVDPTGGGALPQWGDLAGLRDLDPPLRLSFSPYVAGSVQRSPISDDPPAFANSRSFSGGMDVKWGLSESFTLDATLIPNFGETRSDNTVRNLSPFEVQYAEQRQFFTEGTELFNKGEIFYSRRIGGTPLGFYDAANSLDSNEVLVKNPSETRLYNATKISGRTRSKFGIGFLNAISAPEHATIRNEETGAERDFATSELTNYNVLVLDQLLRNNSAIAFTNTSVLRQGQARDADVSALTFNLRDKSNTYEISGAGRLSQVFLPDSTCRGTRSELNLSKISGKWGWVLASVLSDPYYDPRDLGFNRRNNLFTQFAKASYSVYQQQGRWLYQYFEFSADNVFLYEPRQWESLELFLYGEAMNTRQMRFSGFINSRPVWYYDYFEARVPGRQYHHAPWIFVSPQFTTDARKKLFCRFELNAGESPIPKDPYIGIKIQPTWVASDHLRLSGSIGISKDHSNYGAVDWSDPDDIIFGRRNITTFDNQLSADYLFGPRMNLSLRVRHYWSQLYYHEYVHLNEDGSFSPSDWAMRGEDNTADENFNLFNVDFVYTWQFAPGSYLNLIWKDAIFSGDRDRAAGFIRNFDRTIHTPQDNTLTLKLIYWLDVGTKLQRGRRE